MFSLSISNTTILFNCKACREYWYTADEQEQTKRQDVPVGGKADRRKKNLQQTVSSTACIPVGRGHVSLLGGSWSTYPPWTKEGLR